LRIVHVTNHPGIEGTSIIQNTIDQIARKGHLIEFVPLHDVPYAQAMAELGNADLSIGKMKMGYYANFQIESLALGIPAITYVRHEFITPELRDSGFIFSTLDSLGDTLEYILQNPSFLAEKKMRTQKTVRQLHREVNLLDRLLNIYGLECNTADRY
jgi:glycosyltransferase involved in cell wall biosynthesis